MKETRVCIRIFICCYTLFLACVIIWTNFVRYFAVRAVGNALQPQISVINVVSKSMTKTLHLKHLLQQSISHKKENIKKSQCCSSNLRTESMIKYISYKNLRNLLGQLLSCKISYKIQLKNLKYLPPQSLACKVYRKQENELKDLLPQSRCTRKINDKMQQRIVKSLFSQSLLRQINDKMH